MVLMGDIIYPSNYMLTAGALAGASLFGTFNAFNFANAFHRKRMERRGITEEDPEWKQLQSLYILVFGVVGGLVLVPWSCTEALVLLTGAPQNDAPAIRDKLDIELNYGVPSHAKDAGHIVLGPPGANCKAGSIAALCVLPAVPRRHPGYAFL